MWGRPAFAQKTIIAVAANFTAPAKEIAAAFEKHTGRTVVLSFGSTGKLDAQIIHGTPFSALLAADSKRPQLLEDAGLGTSRFTYAQGRLALIRAQKNTREGIVQTFGRCKHENGTLWTCSSIGGRTKAAVSHGV